MANRKKHPHKVLEDAIQFAEGRGWHYKKAGKSAHAWGRLYCPLSSQEGCALSVWSTPRSAEIHAKQILKRIKQCQHKGDRNE